MEIQLRSFVPVIYAANRDHGGAISANNKSWMKTDSSVELHADIMAVIENDCAKVDKNHRLSKRFPSEYIRKKCVDEK